MVGKLIAQLNNNNIMNGSEYILIEKQSAK